MHRATPPARPRALYLLIVTLVATLLAGALVEASGVGQAAAQGGERARSLPVGHEPAPPAPVGGAAPIPPAATVPVTDGALPVGKGMWLWLPERAEGGDPHAIVARARAVGLSHLYVRTGSSKGGFYAGPFLDALLPVAHAAGIRVYGWDFPYLQDVVADAERGATAARHTTPDGHRIDGFVADIETPSEGTNTTPHTALEYGDRLRRLVGDGYPLIACVPRPSAAMLARYPYDEAVAAFDAIAPMVYWLNRQPDTDATAAMVDLARFGKPVIPVGQAYDGAPEGGRPGPPPRHEIIRFMQAAEQAGAVGASFWSWQHATPEIWDAIRDAGEFRFPASRPAELRPAEVRAVSVLLDGMGYETPDTSVWTPEVTRALRSYQADAGLRTTGRIDEATRALLLGVVPPPLGGEAQPRPVVRHVPVAPRLYR